MHDFSEFSGALSDALTSSLDSLEHLASTSVEATAIAEFTAPARSMLTSGKRTRAKLLLAGYSCATAGPISPAVHAGAAFELYQASALVHDDVVDESDVRRGRPAAHKQFSAHHEAHAWLGSSRKFGTNGAIMLGDLLLSQAMIEFSQVANLVEPSDFLRASRRFQEICSEVAFGQYLDIRAENAPFGDFDEARELAMSIIEHKTVQYSVAGPLVIGAMLGGGSVELCTGLERVGRPLGQAFQLRDDDLGVFGAEAATGKPECGDITEGKRTVLLALTLDMANSHDASWLQSVLGQELTPDEVERVRQICESSGARKRHEAMIGERERVGEQEIAKLEARHEGVDVLTRVTQSLARRNS